MSSSDLRILRPHHGLCIRFFRGLGYSEEFTENMTRIIQRLESEDPRIKLLPGCDVLCRKCPHDHGGLCKSAENVRKFDDQVLKLCEIRAGTWMKWSDFSALIRTQILQAGRLQEVCGDCEWYPTCSTSKVLR
ncbi:MAG: DUF1284 domain-containing protein [Oscillospiraceae bacterium]|nr:DUF1284 domain-containing protein [Oscillospiraceae bacterium]